MQENTAQTEALQINVKSFNIVRAITDKNLFSKVKLSPTGRLVLFNLANMYNLKKGYSFPKIKKLILCTGATEKSVISALNELKNNNLIVSSKDKYTTNYYFTKNFFNLLEIFTEETVNITEQPVNITATCHEQKKEQNIKQNNFSFKNLLELSKTNTIKYFEEINKLTESEKEKLTKIKLGRMDLTNFQKENLDKLILLSESEINTINNKEPYFRQENIDIYYNQRMKKINEFKQEPTNQQDNAIKNERETALAVLACGYKTFSNNKSNLTVFLNRNINKMEQFKITEAELLNYSS